MRTILAALVLCVPLVAQQYKRLHQRAMRALVDDGAAACLAVVEELDPDDPETRFVAALAHAAGGDRAAALAAARAAIVAGLPPGRFLAGPRRFTAPLLEDSGFAGEVRAATDGLVHGPTLGDVRPDGVRVWLRVMPDAEVVVTARASVGTPELARATGAGGDDGVVVLDLAGLEPSTRYRYDVTVDGTQVVDGAFHTAPPLDAPTRFTFAFGGGAGFVPEHERMWTTIRGFEPDFLVLLGDNVYIDDPKRPEMQEYTYARRQSRLEWRQLVCDVPVYTIWDDHDFGTNDCHGGPEIDVPPWKRAVGRLFRRQWPNPDGAAGDDDPGCWYAFRRGDVEFVMLDGRCYREDPRSESPSMLGPRQLEWLDATLAKQAGRVEVLCSPVPWVFEAKGDSKDTWNGFRDERAEVFAMLERHQVDAPLLLSADRHRSDAWRIDRGEGLAPLYEFNSSRLTNQHVRPRMKAALFSYNAKQSFGLVTIDTTGERPTATYRVVDIDGEVQHELTVEPGR